MANRTNADGFATAGGPTLTVRGFQLYEGLLMVADQRAVLGDIAAIIAAAPLFSPETPYGKPMSVKLTSAGKYGWYSDRKGYRYAGRHPAGVAWPPIPDRVLAIWRAVSGAERDPDCCLINHYGEGARMGLHQDRDEADFRWPVVSVSLGDDALFRIGNLTRGGEICSLFVVGFLILQVGHPRMSIP